MADRNAASQDPEQLKKILLALEHARADAWLRRDRRALDALLAPDFVETNSRGRFTKTELLDRLFPVLYLHEYVISNPGIRVTGEKSAVLTCRCRERLTVEGKAVEGLFFVSATYTRTGDRFRLFWLETRPAD